MDAVTIIGALGAIASVVDAISKSIKSISELRERWKEADLTLLCLSSQLTALGTALSKIDEWRNCEIESDPHHQLIIDLDTSIKCCKLLMSKINELLGKLGNTTDQPLDFISTVKLVFKGTSIENVQKMIEQQTSALLLLLTACNWWAQYHTTVNRGNSRLTVVAKLSRSKRHCLRSPKHERCLAKPNLTLHPYTYIAIPHP
jgi:hypothetical protein